MKKAIGLLVAVLICSAALASFISMATEFSVAASPAGLELVVSSTNRGDEPSYEVQFEVEAGTKRFTSSAVSRLSVNEKLTERFRVGDAFVVPGRYPVVIKTHYKDGNAYPFSALTVGFYDHQEPTFSKILARGEDASIPANGSGNVTFVLRNNDSIAHSVDAALHLPDELATTVETRTLQLEPGSDETLQYEVENFSALESSAYSIALAVQYEDDGRHYSSAGAAVVRITEPSALSGRWPWVFAGLVLFVVIVVLFVGRRQRKRAQN